MARGLAIVALAVILIAGIAVTQDDGTTTGSATYSGIPDGNHTIEVRACDSAGNCDETPAAISFEVVKENTAPQATATWHADTATISVNTGGDVKEVLFYVNGVMASRKTAIPYERKTAKTGHLVLKQSVRENDGDVAVTTVEVDR